MCNCTISDHRSLNLRCPLRLFNERSINTSDFLVLKLLYHTVCFGHSSTICIKFIVIGSFIVRCPGIKDNNTFFWLSQGIYSFLSSGQSWIFSNSLIIPTSKMPQTLADVNDTSA